MKQVRETKAGQSISAKCILKGGEWIANVHFHYSASGIVMCNVFTKEGLIYEGRAGGYGYDKATAALSGAVIDGIKIYDHSSRDEKLDAILAEYKAEMKGAGVTTENYRDVHVRWFESVLTPIGARFANSQIDDVRGVWIADSAYYESGLARMSLMGYTVIDVI